MYRESLVLIRGPGGQRRVGPAPRYRNQDHALFRSHADELCSSLVVTRLFLCSFLDVNPLFEGTGRTPSGLLEHITIPNPAVAALQAGPADLDILEFDVPELSCDP